MPDHVEQDNNRLEKLIDKIDRLTEAVRSHERLLYGRDGEFGLAHQIKLLWRIHVWVLCALSATGGSIVTGVVMTWFKRL